VREGAERRALAQLISSLDVADLTASIAASGGLLCKDHGRSHGMDLNDSLIATTALEMDLQLLIFNVQLQTSKRTQRRVSCATIHIGFIDKITKVAIAVIPMMSRHRKVLKEVSPPDK
jgi:hypothetical protein